MDDAQAAAMHLLAIPSYTVGEVAEYLTTILALDEILQDLWVRGEVSNLTRAASGHCYFALKDDQAVIKCVLWRSRAQLVPTLRQGMQVLVHGRMDFYVGRGEMQIIVDQVEDIGIGLLYQRFVALQEELRAAGYFAAERKRPVPQAPRVIGIVTSSSGAALRDMIRTLRLRWPLARVVLAPTLVQGEGAADQIAAAIAALNRHGQAEVIIIARGGGSIEDLWAFNERVVADAIADSRIPTVTGIGHETDFTIADYVADVRAATPTAAATLVAPDIRVLRVAVAETQIRLLALAMEQIDRRRDDLAGQRHRLGREHPQERLDRLRRQVGDQASAIQQHMAHRIELERARLAGAALRLQALSPLLTIARGYATLVRDRDQAPVTSVRDVAPAERITIRLQDGRVRATVTGVTPE